MSAGSVVGEGEALGCVVLRQRHAVRTADRDDFAHQLEQEGAGLRVLADRADRRAHRRRRPGQPDQEHVLLPDRAADVVRELGLYAGFERGLEQRLGARRAPAVVLAEHHALHGAGLVDHAGRAMCVAT